MFTTKILLLLAFLLPAIAAAGIVVSAAQELSTNLETRQATELNALAEINDDLN